MVLDKRIIKLNRVIARASLDNKKKEMHLIHLEGSSDAKFFSEYISVKQISVPRNTKCVYTAKKEEAIDEHKKALQKGINIVTIVDMDYDYDEKEISGIDNIFTTKCACTLITMQFQKTIGGGGMMLEGLDKGLIFEFLDKYPKLSKEEVLKKVVESTFERLNRV